MSTLPSSTKYNVNPKSSICTNPDCDACPPGYGNFKGKNASAKCHKCGEQLTIIRGEPHN